jgi:hypothetical protein
MARSQTAFSVVLAVLAAVLVLPAAAGAATLTLGPVFETTLNPGHVALVALANGEVVAAWPKLVASTGTDASAIVTSVQSPSGAWSPPVVAVSAPGRTIVDGPDLTAAGSTAVLAWATEPLVRCGGNASTACGPRPSFKLMAAKLASGGWSPAEQIYRARGLESPLSLASTSTGVAVIEWGYFDAKSELSRLMYSALAGTSWTPARTLVSDRSGGSSAGATESSDDGGRFVQSPDGSQLIVAWQHARDLTAGPRLLERTLRYRHVLSTGSLGPVAQAHLYGPAPRRTYWSDDGYAVAIDDGGNITVAYAYDTSAAHVPPVEHWDASTQLNAVGLEAADVGRPVIYASATHVAALWNFGSEGVADAVAPVGGGAFGPQAIAFPYCTAGECGLIPSVALPDGTVELFNYDNNASGLYVDTLSAQASVWTSSLIAVSGDAAALQAQAEAAVARPDGSVVLVLLKEGAPTAAFSLQSATVAAS